MNPHLIRKDPHYKGTFFDRNPDVVEFLESVDQYYSLKDLREMIIEKFGIERTPSQTALHAYIQKLTKEQGGIDDCNSEQ